MKDYFTIFYKSIFFLCITSLALPVNTIQAENNSYVQYANCEESCCNEDGWFNKGNLAVIGAAVVLGGVAGAIAGNATKSKHHGHSSCNNVFKRDIGQTLNISAQFEIEDLTGSVSFVLYAIVAGADPVVSEPFVFSNDISEGPFPPVGLELNINNPIIGSYTIGIRTTLSTGTDDHVATSDVVIFIAASKDPTDVIEHTPEIHIFADDYIGQDEVTYGYFLN